MAIVEKIAAGGYLPSNDDILYLRYKTEAVTEKIFTINKKIIKVYDVAGTLS